MNRQEENLDQALKNLKSGTGLHKAVLDFPDQDKEQVRELLSLAERLKGLPAAKIPSPARQRKYLLHKVRQVRLGWLPFSRMAGLSMSLVLLFSAAIGTGYAATNSVPGQTLFSIKKTTEKLQLKLASSPEAKAGVHVEIAKKRLNEAAKVFKNPEASPKQEKAVLTELVAETKNTIAAVTNAAKESPKAEQNMPMIATLEDITKKQQDLFNEIAPQGKLSAEAESVLVATQENVTKVAEIKQYLEAAASEQALADLGNDADTITLTGAVDKLEPGLIRVEGKDFSLLEKTIIKDKLGKTMATSSLAAARQVSVVGYGNDGKLLAKEVTILTALEPGEVKGGSVASGTSSPATSSTSPKILANPARQTASNPATTTQAEPEIVNPNTATGSFIMEDPSPQAPF